MQSTLTHISNIKPNPNNPRIIKDMKFKQLVQSIKDFPEMLELRPIIVNDDMIVLWGNMRLKACRDAGLTEIPVIRANSLTPEQQKEFIIKDNVSFWEWDYDALTSEWDQSDLERWWMDLPEFVPDDTNAVDDNYELPDEAETDIVAGDRFTLQSWDLTHTLICGSSTDPATFDGIKADMMFSDPPYLMNFKGAMTGDGSHNKKHKVIKNDDLWKDEWNQFLRDFLSIVPSICSGAWYISFYRLGIDRLFSALTDTGMKWRNLIIWKKEHKNLSNSDYQSIYEPIFYGFQDDYNPIVYGWSDNHTFYGGKWKQNDVWNDIQLPSIWEINRTKKNDLHPTMKPVELISRCIRNSSKPWETVLDMFLWSGTTMVASHQMKRKCIGVELDPFYCSVILDRMKKLDNSLTILRNWQAYEQKTIWKTTEVHKDIVCK